MAVKLSETDAQRAKLAQSIAVSTAEDARSALHLRNGLFRELIESYGHGAVAALAELTGLHRNQLGRIKDGRNSGKTD